MSLAEEEKKKYEKVWALSEYHRYSPAQKLVPLFKQMVKVPKKEPRTLLDIGAGTGRASRELAGMGWDVTMLDHVQVSLDTELPFIKANIFGNWSATRDYGLWTTRHWQQGFCCDVMEHIPPEKVDAALKNIMFHCERVFFSINFQKDHFGAQVGHPLHLTVKPFMWWVRKLSEFGFVNNARDLIGEGVFDVKG